MTYRTSHTKIWPYLSVLGLLFYMTLSIPRHWEQSGRSRTLDQVLAARPTPSQPLVVESTSELREDNIELELDPFEPVEDAESLDDIVIVEPIAPVADPFGLPSLELDIHDDWSFPPADPPLPPAIDDPHATPVPANGWPRPQILLKQIERIGEHPLCADWAKRIAAHVAELTTDQRPSAERTQELLEDIRDMVAPIESLIDQTENNYLQSQLRRVRYALRRRLDLWQLAHEATRATYDRLASRAPLEELALPPAPIAPPVDQAIRDVRTYTEGRTNGPTWEQFLRLSDLEILADNENPIADQQARRRAVAHRVLVRLARLDDRTRYAPVAQNPAIGQLREALRHWSSETVDARELLEHIEQYELHGLPSDARQIAIHYQRLAFAPQERDQQLGTRLARHYRNANVRMAISSQMLNRMLPAPSEITEPIDEYIGGVPSWGESNTKTKLRLRLIPDARRLHMALEAHGTVESESESDAGFAQLYSEGTSRFAARKTIVADHRQVHLLPAIAKAESSNELVDIFTRLDSVPLFGSLADNIVRAQRDRRYDQVVSEVEEMVSEKARVRLDEEVTTRSENAQEKLNRKVVSPLARFGLAPTAISFQTTDQRVILRHRLAGYEQLGAHTPRPRAPSDSLVSWQIHQSALNNALENLQLAGKTFDIASLHGWIHERLGRPCGELDEDMPEDVELKFPSRDVLRVTCDDGRVTVMLVFSKLTKGRRSWTNFGVRVRYVPQVDGRQVKLVRQGSFEIVSRKYGSKPQFLLRSIVARMLNETKELDLVPAKIADDERIADLAVTQLDIVDGWIAAALGPQRNGRYVVTREAEQKK